MPLGFKQNRQRCFSKLRNWSMMATRALVRGVQQLKQHPNRWVRRALAIALILGGVFAFLPILGIWMLPLGLVILSDETTALRRPRRRLQIWLGRRLSGCRMPET